ncbi:MAG: hypothetical protein GF315_12215 [candidate division Zixibacteria bacterium]|nr:hypothetical protein [candidate division Zixibacteria bacterium]
MIKSYSISTFFVTLMVFFLSVFAVNCSQDKETAENQPQEEPELSAETFVEIHLDLQRVDRKYSKVLDSFLKRNDIKGEEYRLIADSLFIEANRELVTEYSKITDRLGKEKSEVFSRHGVSANEYENMLRALSNSEKSEWADSVANLISKTG